jgi:hypothetical protein
MSNERELDEDQWDELIAKLYALLKKIRRISSEQGISFAAAFEILNLEHFPDNTQEQKERLYDAIMQIAKLEKEAS